MVGEYKTLGELVQSDPALKGRVVVAKVSTAAQADSSCCSHSADAVLCLPTTTALVQAIWLQDGLAGWAQ